MSGLRTALLPLSTQSAWVTHLGAKIEEAADEGAPEGVRLGITVGTLLGTAEGKGEAVGIAEGAVFNRFLVPLPFFPVTGAVGGPIVGVELG